MPTPPTTATTPHAETSNGGRSAAVSKVLLPPPSAESNAVPDTTDTRRPDDKTVGEQGTETHDEHASSDSAAGGPPPSPFSFFSLPRQRANTDTANKIMTAQVQQVEAFTQTQHTPSPSESDTNQKQLKIELSAATKEVTKYKTEVEEWAEYVADLEQKCAAKDLELVNAQKCAADLQQKLAAKDAELENGQKTAHVLSPALQLQVRSVHSQLVGLKEDWHTFSDTARRGVHEAQAQATHDIQLLSTQAAHVLALLKQQRKEELEDEEKRTELLCAEFRTMAQQRDHLVLCQSRQVDNILNQLTPEAKQTLFRMSQAQEEETDDQEETGMNTGQGTDVSAAAAQSLFANLTACAQSLVASGSGTGESYVGDAQPDMLLMDDNNNGEEQNEVVDVDSAAAAACSQPKHKRKGKKHRKH